MTMKLMPMFSSQLFVTFQQLKSGKPFFHLRLRGDMPHSHSFLGSHILLASIILFHSSFMKSINVRSLKNFRIEVLKKQSINFSQIKPIGRLIRIRFILVIAPYFRSLKTLLIEPPSHSNGSCTLQKFKMIEGKMEHD